FLVTGGFDGALRLWDLASGKMLHQFGFGPTGSQYTFNSDWFRITADGMHLAAVARPNTESGGQSALCVWDTATGELIERRTFPVDHLSQPESNGGTKSRTIFHSCFSRDGALVTVWDKTQLQVADALTGRVRATIAGDLGRPSAF